MRREEIDIRSAATYEREVPHEMYAWLRREAPVFWHPESDGPGFWALTKHADIRTASRDNAVFSTEVGGTFIHTPAEEEMVLTRMTLLNMDDPKHARYRQLVNKGFTPRMIAKLHEHICELSRRIVDSVAPVGRCDFVYDLAAELPLQVICAMMGVPQEDRALILDWSNRMVGFDDSDLRTSPEDGKNAAAELFAYCDQLAGERRKNPQDDILTAIIQAEIDGDRLTTEEIDMFFTILVIAGNETTRNLMANGMLALFQNPAQRARLAAQPDVLPSAVEEMLRYGASIIDFRRTATQDVRVRDTLIRAGDKVVLYYLAGNFDEEVFAEPERFDVARNPNDHLTFGGGGTHFCLGANLARLEIHSLFEEVLRRLPDIEQVGSERRLRSDFINGLKELPVRFTPEPASAR